MPTTTTILRSRSFGHYSINCWSVRVVKFFIFPLPEIRPSSDFFSNLNIYRLFRHRCQFFFFFSRRYHCLLVVCVVDHFFVLFVHLSIPYFICVTPIAVVTYVEKSRKVDRLLVRDAPTTSSCHVGNSAVVVDRRRRIVVRVRRGRRWRRRSRVAGTDRKQLDESVDRRMDGVIVSSLYSLCLA